MIESFCPKSDEIRRQPCGRLDAAPTDVPMPAPNRFDAQRRLWLFRSLRHRTVECRILLSLSSRPGLLLAYPGVPDELYSFNPRSQGKLERGEPLAPRIDILPL
jgi:hypothetical protein